MVRKSINFQTHRFRPNILIKMWFGAFDRKVNWLYLICSLRDWVKSSMSDKKLNKLSLGVGGFVPIKFLYLTSISHWKNIYLSMKNIDFWTKIIVFWTKNNRIVTKITSRLFPKMISICHRLSFEGGWGGLAQNLIY